ncbi:unnamed protein product [Linum trigynum]|uniref:Uncharacterized protein n=1 Tax=Linum trigynum TaxID=586398 RepID=A0AAV2GLR1_9ROSI
MEKKPVKPGEEVVSSDRPPCPCPAEKKPGSSLGLGFERKSQGLREGRGRKPRSSLGLGRRWDWVAVGISHKGRGRKNIVRWYRKEEERIKE